jgi:hypothetical protein
MKRLKYILIGRLKHIPIDIHQDWLQCQVMREVPIGYVAEFNNVSLSKATNHFVIAFETPIELLAYLAITQ